MGSISAGSFDQGTPNGRHAALSRREADALWAQALVTVQAEHPTLVRVWFEELEPISLESGQLVVRCASEVQRDHMDRECSRPFTDAARMASGQFVNVRFVGPTGQGPQPARIARQLAI